jgi:UDP-glucose 4-epimerase
MYQASQSDTLSGIFNLGTREAITVNESIGIISKELDCVPQRLYSGGIQGWVGDSPRILLNTDRIESTGWHPSKSIEESVRETVTWLIANQWVFGEN